MRRVRTRLLLCLAFWITGSLGIAWRPVTQKSEASVGSSAPLPRSIPPRGTSEATSSPRIEECRLSRGGSRLRRITPVTIHSYTFNLRKGEFLHLIFDQKTVDITIDVLDPEENKILEIDTLNGAQGPEDVPFVAESAGIYRIRVFATSSGVYIPHISVCRRATPLDRARAKSALAYYRAEKGRKANLPLAKVENGYLNAARLAGEVGDKLRRADAFYQLGQLQCKQRRWRDCHGSCFRALALYRIEKNHSQEAIILNQLGRSLEGLLDQKGALKAYALSSQIARRFSDEATEATASLNLGILELEAGEVEPALKSFERARELNHHLGKRKEEAMDLNATGRAYVFLGEIDQALAAHKEALDLLKGESGARLASTLVHIADAYRAAEKFSRATVYYLRGMEQLRKAGDSEEEAKALNNLGLSYYRSKQYHDALNTYLQALRIFQDHGDLVSESACWANIGWLQISLDQIPRAIESLERSLKVSRQSGRRPSEASAYFGIAWAERHRHNLLAAQRNALQAINILESLRNEAVQSDSRTSLLASRFNFYDFLVDILMEQHRMQPAGGHDVEAFEASERARGRSLLESLGEESAPPSLSLSEIQRLALDGDTVLLEYHLGDDRSVLWVVSQESYASYELPGRAEIEPLAREVYASLKTSHRREDLPIAVQKARELAKRLLGPVASRLSNKRLLIVAPSSLQYIPFAALPDPSVSTLDSSDLSWPVPLVVQHEVVNAPSATIIAALKSARAGRKAPRRRLAIFADAVYERSDERLKKASPVSPLQPLSPDPFSGRFKRLRYSRQEADEIVKAAGGQDVLELLDFDANRERFLESSLKSYAYIHVSAHGDSNVAQPIPSIVLSAYDSRGQRRDPYLRAKDIQKLGLSANLVVLSACRSGLGREIRGEGLVGLSQAFLSGGASGVLVSIWDVDDLATSEIMPLFYANLLKKGLPPSAAFRDAQISMWRQPRWNAPSYWGGFIQQGDWR